MIKVFTIIGARPQIIKAAAINREIKNNFSDRIEEYILHTGQHYDNNMSEIFFGELEIPLPNTNLNIGSMDREDQIEEMILKISEVLEKEKPNCVLVYGDTNSTNAGSVASANMNIPVIHVEAGLRSFNKSMPEESNRIICDNLSMLLFSPTKAGIQNLINEGFQFNNNPPFNLNNPKIYHCGDVMFDNSLHFAELAKEKSKILSSLGLLKNGFVLATVHRNYNTDNVDCLESIFRSFLEIQKKHNISFVIPIHPRTMKILSGPVHEKLLSELKLNDQIKIIPPVSYLDMISLESNCRLIMTDSGGVQKESFFFKKPCIVLRSETEWIELIENGNNILVDANTNAIVDSFNYLINKTDFSYPSFYGDGNAAKFICNEIITNIN